MNNKGFTLIEVLLTIFIISILFFAFIFVMGDTFGITGEKSYEITKKSIISQVNQYIYECDNNLISCSGDYVWLDYENGKITSFNLGVMKKYHYLSDDDYVNPITGKEISECLVINVIKDSNMALVVSLDDNKCKNKE